VTKIRLSACLKSQMPRLQRDMQAAHGSCPGLQAAESHLQEYCDSSEDLNALNLEESMNLLKLPEFTELDTCVQDIAGVGSCRIPNVKPACCDLFGLMIDCAVEAKGDQDKDQACLKSQMPRLQRDMQAAHGSCPGLQAAQSHLQEYCDRYEDVNALNLEASLIIVSDLVTKQETGTMWYVLPAFIAGAGVIAMMVSVNRKLAGSKELYTPLAESA